MDEGTVVEQQPRTRRRIIERPRLTRLLDKTKARLILLHAPAGYGKTTLARQWLEDAGRTHAWYSSTSASHDVAALAAGMGRSAAVLVPGAGDRLVERLRVTKDPAREVDVLAEMLAEDLAVWPDDAWFAIDDYHLMLGSEAAEEFVRLLRELTGIRMLIASRERPSWVSARDIVYGEAFEIGRNLLAMDYDEAAVLLAERERTPAGLISLADGWPAVLALASLQPELDISRTLVPEALHSFFAEELFQQLDSAAQAALRLIAIAGVSERDLVCELIDDLDAGRFLEVVARVGFISDDRAHPEVHPLLRAFLIDKERERPQDEIARDIDRVVGFLATHKRWDDAFDVILAFGRTDLLASLIAACLYELLDSGRSASVVRWLELMDAAGDSSEWESLARAEIAFREGRFFEAETLAAGAATQAASGPVQFRAWGLAARAAHVGSRENKARAFYRHAANLAETDEDRRYAEWGELSCAVDLGAPDAVALYEASGTPPNETPDELTMYFGRRLSMESRIAGRITCLSEAREAATVLHFVRDPVRRTSFLNTYGYVLAITGHYEDASRVASALIDEAHAFRLPFVVPYALATSAIALCGQHQPTDALALLERAESLATGTNDRFALLNVRAVRARTLVALRDFAAALAATYVDFAGVIVSMQGEVLAARAVALACLGRTEEAIRAAHEAEALAPAVEIRVGAAVARAIAGIQRSAPETAELVRDAVHTAVETTAVDGLITAYRGFPDLLVLILSDATRDVALSVVDSAGDGALATAISPMKQGPERLLSPRETEVLALLCRGLSNRQIANTLFISEATAKVHVRHILEKLGVRTRTAAVVAAMRAGYATSAMEGSDSAS